MKSRRKRGRKRRKKNLENLLAPRLEEELASLLGNEAAGPVDLEALETAFRETALSVAARILEGVLNRDLSDGEPRERPCSCGATAGLRGRIEKTVQSILGPLVNYQIK